ncbi:YgiQ family radical SAM protein [Myxococcota bacterium]|nr:YgiQ family radical SAM protein [Myxococcota bacterium]
MPSPLVDLPTRGSRRGGALPFLPMTRAEVDALGWEAPDVVFVTGDAYVDHPSFAMALLGRVLEAAGYRVAILSQPDWRSAEPFRALGRPRLCYAVSAGNMDSMINHYTANRKPRSDDAYSPGGAAGRRPDRAAAVYAQRCREAGKGVPVIVGGVEASLRRVAHYDYWSDTVLPSILVSSKADLLVYGMGEAPLLEIVRHLDTGGTFPGLRDMRSVCWLGRGSEAPPSDALAMPSFEEVRDDKRAFAVATRILHGETNPFHARRLVQLHGGRAVVQNPPALPLSEAEMDAIYDLPFARRPHPSYRERIPAYETVRFSVTLMRGCFGGCAFCSITTHQGKTVQSRSKDSLLREVRDFAADPGFGGTVSDLGGPTANMYRMRCTRPEVEAICRRPSCVHPKVCKLLGTDHAPLLEVMREARRQPGVEKVLVASGVRMDLARLSPEYLEDLAAHHVGGHLKVAPEHASDRVLGLMRKPPVQEFHEFDRAFRDASRRVGKEQYLVPYFIASHPGSGVEDMIELALFLKRQGYRPRQVQDFIPAPLDVATCMYHTGLDPATMEPVPVARRVHDRKVQRALLQFFEPRNWFVVREALREAGREDLVGGKDGLIPAHPPREALLERRRAAGPEDTDEARDRDHGEASGRGGRSVGYRPGRRGGRPSR